MATLDQLVQHLAARRPASALAVGPAAAQLAQPLRAACPACAVETLDAAGELPAPEVLERLAGKGRYALAIVGGELERLDAEAGANLLARLRDLHAARLCVLVARACPAWQSAELRAFALTRWDAVSAQGGELEVYDYDIGSYKKTPDWLSPEHWAHPENWNKHRW